MVDIPDAAVQAAMDEVHSYDYSPDGNDFLKMKDALTAVLPHLAPLGYEVKQLEWFTAKGHVCDKMIARDCFGNEFSRIDMNGKSDAKIKQLMVEAQADFERRVRECIVSKPVDVAAVRRQAFEDVADWYTKHGWLLDEDNIANAIRALSAEPAQATFDSADWFYRDNDPDDSGDTPHEAITHHPEYSVHLVHSSFIGDSRYVFRAPTLDPSDDEDEVLDFATEEEAIAAACERRSAIEALPAAPTTEAGL